MKLSAHTQRALAIVKLVAMLALEIFFWQPTRLLLTAVLVAFAWRHAHWAMLALVLLVIARLEFSAWATAETNRRVPR